MITERNEKNRVLFC